MSEVVSRLVINGPVMWAVTLALIGVAGALIAREATRGE